MSVDSEGFEFMFPFDRPVEMVIFNLCKVVRASIVIGYRVVT